jgi:hypothetical protein
MKQQSDARLTEVFFRMHSAVVSLTAEGNRFLFHQKFQQLGLK